MLGGCGYSHDQSFRREHGHRVFTERTVTRGHSSDRAAGEPIGTTARTVSCRAAPNDPLCRHVALTLHQGHGSETGMVTRTRVVSADRTETRYAYRED